MSPLEQILRCLVADLDEAGSRWALVALLCEIIEPSDEEEP